MSSADRTFEKEKRTPRPVLGLKGRASTGGSPAIFRLVDSSTSQESVPRCTEAAMPHVLAFPSNKLARQQKSRILAATTLTALIPPTTGTVGGWSRASHCDETRVISNHLSWRLIATPPRRPSWSASSAADLRPATRSTQDRNGKTAAADSGTQRDRDLRATGTLPVVFGRTIERPVLHRQAVAHELS